MAKSLVNYIHIRMTELKGFASCVLQFLFLLCLFMFFIGCYETEVANIMVKVDSKVDMNK
jgi:Na+-transporting methylmalonyl-CoA/oxaloacetate decarboxylase gamma subunit